MGNITAKNIFLLPVRFYRKFISPAIGSNCIYEPTCSEYFIESVEKHGIVKGFILGSARLLRCNRFYLGGPDEVPKVFSFKVIRDNRIRFRRLSRKKL